ncbi:hypothetical protein ACEQ8H_002185 [Pleosporales sp. CAS-2024a]
MAQQHGYGGNPYGQPQPGYDQQSNPYGGGGYGSANPYGGAYDEESTRPANLTQTASGYTNTSEYSQQPPASQTVPHTNVPLQQPYGQAPLEHGTQPLSREDYLSRIEGTKQRIAQLTSDIQSIASIHQRLLSSPDNRSSAELESIVSQTQIRNTQIKDEIKFLERDASRGSGSDSFKRTQVESLKRNFTTQLQDFQKEESDYSKRYREAIGRQYRIINPDATDAEVQEAASADWGDEGIFTQALKSNRSGQASSVLGAVRARHNDIQQIEKTMGELSLLFTQLNEMVVYQEPQVARIEEQTVQVNEDAKHANTQLDHGIKSARNRRKLKWYTLLVVVLIVVILALVLGIYFGTKKNN